MSHRALKPVLYHVSPTLNFNEVRGSDFGDQVSRAINHHDFHRTNLSPHPEGYANYRCWMQSDGSAGYAVSRLPVHETGHRELINVFSTVSRMGNGERLIAHAKETYGHLILDCYDGVLVDFYGRQGFIETSRSPNWNAGGPDIVFMRCDR
jgi:hypothetical protein